MRKAILAVATTAATSLALIGGTTTASANEHTGDKPKVTIEHVDDTMNVKKEVCGFPVTIHNKGTSRITEYKNGNAKVENLRDSYVKVTRDDGHHRSYWHTQQGVLHINPSKDGKKVTITGRGSIDAWSTTATDPIAFRHWSKVGVFVVDGHFRFVNYNLDQADGGDIKFTRADHVTNVCKVLSHHHGHH